MSEKDIRETFDRLDQNKTKGITPNDVIKGLHMLLYHPTDLEEADIKHNLCMTEDGLVTYEEFESVISSWIKGVSYESQLFMEAFTKVDKDNSGYIDKDELRTWLKRKDHEWTTEDEEDLNDLFNDADVNHNGKVEYSEFVKAFCGEEL
ncbi:calmodulin-like [Mytilus edulis]|uniref:calmodulin-like n=1 Tax=Mytilus edulis TaxID=6550 RepID=UPI0039EE0EC9